ncbi:type I-E CRISPR-associated protein Cse2/CasB [Streptomyces sp. BI20]|uniref:type I-E CRISPR-associated protein Cse2/CasB n=1 Tax=Streptomyces sp. BI20 TaxID=3403460 RepID=UPI003C780192
MTAIDETSEPTPTAPPRRTRADTKDTAHVSWRSSAAGRDRVKEATKRSIGSLQSRYQNNEASGVATVARLRRLVGQPVHQGELGLAHMEELHLARRLDLDREQTRTGNTETPASLLDAQADREDEAVHTAVTLWALHQQSIRDERMHRRGWSLGHSVRALAMGTTRAPSASRSTNAEEKDAIESNSYGPPIEELPTVIRGRFNRIRGSEDVAILTVRLRELVTLLRGVRVPVDYEDLALAVYDWSDLTRRDQVRRKWAREFHSARRPAHEPENPPAN